MAGHTNPVGSDTLVVSLQAMRALVMNDIGLILRRSRCGILKVVQRQLTASRLVNLLIILQQELAKLVPKNPSPHSLKSICGIGQFISSKR